MKNCNVAVWDEVLVEYSYSHIDRVYSIRVQNREHYIQRKARVGERSRMSALRSVSRMSIASSGCSAWRYAAVERSGAGGSTQDSRNHSHRWPISCAFCAHTVQVYNAKSLN